jgi:hypothetical protein
MISFHRVLGDGGARQYRFIHSQEGYGDAILSAHHTVPGDAMLIFSHSGYQCGDAGYRRGREREGHEGDRGDVHPAFLGHRRDIPAASGFMKLPMW